MIAEGQNLHTDPPLTWQGKRVLSIPEFLCAYNMRRAKFYLLKAEGLAPKTIKLGRRVYIAVEDAEAWLNDLRQKEVA